MHTGQNQVYIAEAIKCEIFTNFVSRDQVHNFFGTVVGKPEIEERVPAVATVEVQHPRVGYGCNSIEQANEVDGDISF